MWKYLLGGVKCFFTKFPSVRSAGEEISIVFHEILYKHPLGMYSLYCIDAQEGVLKNVENQSLFWQKCSLIFPIHTVFLSISRAYWLKGMSRHDAHVSWFLWFICRAIKPIFVLLFLFSYTFDYIRKYIILLYTQQMFLIVYLLRINLFYHLYSINFFGY